MGIIKASAVSFGAVSEIFQCSSHNLFLSLRVICALQEKASLKRKGSRTKLMQLPDFLKKKSGRNDSNICPLASPSRYISDPMEIPDPGGL